MNSSKEHCPANETLAAYVDLRLDLSERDRVEAHLAACDECRAEALALAGLRADVAASDLMPSPRLRSAVMARMPSRRPPFRRPAGRPQGWGVAAATAVAAAALIAVVLALATGRQVEAPPSKGAPAAAEATSASSTAPVAEPAPKPVERVAPAPTPDPAPPPAPTPAPAPPAPAPIPVPKPLDPARADPPEKPKPDPAPAPPEPAPKPPEPPRAEPTRMVLATLQRVEGQVFLVQGNERRPATASAEILSGHGIAIAAGSTVLRYPDGTAVELGPESRVARFFEDEGKRLELTQGSLRATVVKQPAGRPFAVLTPHGEARVAGTTFRLTVKAGVTRLEVTEGKVQLKGPAGKPVDVGVGHFGVATAGVEPAARPVTSLLAHWKLDETAGRVAIDASGNGNDAALTGQADWTPGKIGGGLSCAKGGFAAETLEFMGAYSGNALTFAFWAWQDNLHDWQDGYFNFSPAVSMIREGNMDRGRLRTIWKTDGEAENLAADALVRPRQWIHVAVAWDGAIARLYRNGRLAGSSRVKGTLDRNGGYGVRVGADPNAKVDFDLRLDDIQVYRRALSPQEILQVMGGATVR